MENLVPPDSETRGQKWDAADRVAGEFKDALGRLERPSIRTELKHIDPKASVSSGSSSSSKSSTGGRTARPSAQTMTNRSCSSQSEQDENDSAELDGGIKRSPRSDDASGRTEADRSLQDSCKVG